MLNTRPFFSWCRRLGGVVLGIVLSSPWAMTAESPRGMVATVHPLATQAGVSALERGGNAVDAAVAAALTLGVVDGHNSGIGGGCLILVRRADGKLFALDGRETAPAKAHRTMYVEAAAAGLGQDGRVGQGEGKRRATDYSQTGALAVAVPGALAAYELAVREHGRLTLSDLISPAAQIAEDGFAIDRVYAGNLADKAQLLARFSASRAILLKSDGAPYREGERLVQTDLAKSYRAIAREGVQWFYQGEYARQVEQWMQAHGGVLTASDLANYRPRERNPLVTRYCGHTVVGFPPPSSGGIHVAQMLYMLQQFPLEEWFEQDSARCAHVIIEAMKLAFADRAHWLGDSDFVRVPRGLMHPDYGRDLAQRINLERATPVTQAGTPPEAATDVFSKHTTHVAAADAAGNWVALTATINTSFGSKVIVPGTGILLNNEMDDFAVEPGVPNAFGLVGAEANAVEPGKRPLSSMSPTIVLRNGDPVFTVGAAGGPTIISQVLLAIVRQLNGRMSPAEALSGARFHHQWSPDVVRLEKSAPAELKRELQARGHVLEEVSRMGVSQAIAWDSQRRLFVGVSDPRVPGLASGPR
ncbi:MAG: gamma-glutamyltransferase [Planctomycetota bacterium]